VGLVLVSLYVACEIIANVTAGRPVQLGSMIVPSAVFIYTLTFTLIDLIHEVYGKSGTRMVVYGAFAANIVLAAYSYLVLLLPAPGFFSETNAYATVLGSTPRIVLASLTAYLASSLVDVEVYHLWRRRVGRWKWSRVLVSNVVSTFVDSVVFICLAFYGTLPVIPLIKGQYVIKMAITMFSLPLIYIPSIRSSVVKAATRSEV
jgi:queuosine precursor transporter